MIFVGLQDTQHRGQMDRACADKLMSGGRDGNGIHGSVSLCVCVIYLY